MNTVISDQHPQVCFLHCEKLRALTKLARKDSSLAFFFLVSLSLALSRRTFSAGGGGGGMGRSHPSHPHAYAPDLHDPLDNL